VTHPTRGRAGEVLREVERRLDAAEARAYLARPISGAERQDVLALVAWFRRRYPTPASRLAYVRRACARWRHTSGLVRERPR
jgi:hypothetical protein